MIFTRPDGPRAFPPPVRCVSGARLAGFLDLKLVHDLKTKYRTEHSVEICVCRNITQIYKNISRRGGYLHPSSPAALRRLPREAQPETEFHTAIILKGMKKLRNGHDGDAWRKTSLAHGNLNTLTFMQCITLQATTLRLIQSFVPNTVHAMPSLCLFSFTMY